MTAECDRCGGPHHQPTHDAVDRVHDYLAERIALVLAEDIVDILADKRKPLTAPSAEWTPPPIPQAPAKTNKRGERLNALGNPAESITIAKVAELHEEGLTNVAIAVKLGCSHGLVSKRLMEAREAGIL